MALLIVRESFESRARFRGHAPAGTNILLVTRLIIISIVLGSFALVFAELVRHSEETSLRPLPTASRCGDAVGTPCPQRAL
ncbi:hypothetical protein FJ964_02125 [Mesorhizobium sp. B2-3-2]|nr:hypothetical protein FJ964_02125 [Mesorhizobium sp. B2-3-2]